MYVVVVGGWPVLLNKFHCRKAIAIFLSLASPFLGVRERMRERDGGLLTFNLDGA